VMTTVMTTVMTGTTAMVPSTVMTVMAFVMRTEKRIKIVVYFSIQLYYNSIIIKNNPTHRASLRRIRWQRIRM